MILRLDLGGHLDKIPRTWAWVKVLACLMKSIIKYTFAMLSFVSGEDRSENGKEFYTSNRARPTVYIPIELKKHHPSSDTLCFLNNSTLYVSLDQLLFMLKIAFLYSDSFKW